jgi:VWFA-related protein
MRLPSNFDSLLLLALVASPCASPQTGNPASQADQTYRYSLPVDEVNLTFHAADAHGLPVNDLQLDELRILDSGKPPRRVLSFHLMQDYPLRAGILIDTSESMQAHVSANRVIAMRYAQSLLRQKADQAFVMDFGYISKITQPWTSDPAALTGGIRQVIAGRENPLGGTALFDTLFRACFSVFGNIDHAASGNFILLFTDGEDNSSHTSLREVVDQCQRTSTAIFVFRAELDSGAYASGPRNLVELATQTGGRVFNADDSESKIESDLRAIEANLRNQYRLIYNPAELRHDGAFHRIELRAPARVDTISVRSGYYAPAR